MQVFGDDVSFRDSSGLSDDLFSDLQRDIETAKGDSSEPTKPTIEGEKNNNVTIKKEPEQLGPSMITDGSDEVQAADIKSEIKEEQGQDAATNTDGVVTPKLERTTTTDGGVTPEQEAMDTEEVATEEVEDNIGQEAIDTQDPVVDSDAVTQEDPGSDSLETAGGGADEENGAHLHAPNTAEAHEAQLVCLKFIFFS